MDNSHPKEQKTKKYKLWRKSMKQVRPALSPMFLICCSLLATQSEARRPHNGPPPEAYTACEGKQQREKETSSATPGKTGQYPVVGTGIKNFYSNHSIISAPSRGKRFYGQDAHYKGNQPAYRNNGNRIWVKNELQSIVDYTRLSFDHLLSGS
jgi:hypothetical protein